MQQTVKLKGQPSLLKAVLSAVKKLSSADKQLLRLKLGATDALAEMKSFESRLKKNKQTIKKTDDEIVSIAKSIRKRKYASSQKMLH